MKTYRCVIVEDEPLAQRIIQKHLTAFPEFVLVACCENAVKAFEAVSTQKVDLLFLDVTLPVMNGIDFVRSLRYPPSIIFTTAYSEFAATSYELEAIDYLVKPITFERFAQAVTRFKRMQERETQEEKNFLFIKDGGKLVKVLFVDILFIEARKDYLLVQTTGQRFLTHCTMKAMEEELPTNHFVRIHRSYIVATKAVQSIAANWMEVKGHTLPIGEKYKSNLPPTFRRPSEK